MLHRSTSGYMLISVGDVSGYILMKRTVEKRIRQSPRALALQRRQLDAKLKSVSVVDTPRGGWIRTIRAALGMSLKQLGKRMGISPQAVLEIETRERDEAITIAKLRQAADALNCDVRIVLVPRTSLEAIVLGQAERKARQDREQLLHTMRLENQDEGVEPGLESGAADRWLKERAARLWD